MKHLKFLLASYLGFVRDNSVLYSIAVGILSPWGQFSLIPSEILLVPLAIANIWYRVLFRSWYFPVVGAKALRWLMVALFISCIGFLASDLFRGIPVVELLKAQMRMWVMLLNIIGILCLLVSSWRNFAAIVGSYALFKCIDVLMNGPEGGKTDDFDLIWRWGLALPVSYLVGISASYLKRKASSVLMILLGILHLSLENRSFGGACILAGALIYAPELPQQFRRLSVALTAGMGLCLIIFLYSFFRISESSRSEESNINRTAMVSAGINVFLDNPVLGQGSTLPYFRFENQEFFKYYTEKRAELKGDIRALNDNTDESVLHSQLVGALASGGILGGVFYFYIGWLFIRSLWTSSTIEYPFRVVMLLLLFRCSFELVAGPFLTSSRFELAIGLAPIMAITAARRKQ